MRRRAHVLARLVVARTMDEIRAKRTRGAPLLPEID
jgi:hypothetical protein